MAGKHLWATKLTSNDSAAKEQLGMLRKEWDSSDACFKTYRYVRNQSTDNIAIADGTALTYSDILRQVAGADVSDADSNQPIGVGIGVITDDYYGWIQTGGYHSAVLTDGGTDFADGDWVMVHASSNGVAERGANSSAAVDTPLGVAVGAYSDSTVPTWLTLNEL